MAVFYAVSTGPGDSELICLKAVRVLRGCEIIFYPQSKKDTIALDSLSCLGNEIDLEHKTLVPCSFSMTSDKKKSELEYEAIACQCVNFLKDGKSVAMISIGDVSLYSTAGRTARIIKNSVIPADAFFMNGKLEAALKSDGTKVLMKMGHHLKEIISLLGKLDLLQNATLVQKASLADEKIFYGEEILSMDEKDFENAYLSVLILKTENLV